jgi:hypothetical protein
MWIRLAINPSIRRAERVLLGFVRMVQSAIPRRAPRPERRKHGARDAGAVDAGRLFHGARGVRKELGP